MTKEFTIQLDEKTYEQAVQIANSKNLTVSEYVRRLVVENLPNPSFESRQIIGRIIQGSKLDEVNNLVEVSGIYYRYHLENPYQNELKQYDYQIINNDGNQLYLKQLHN
ncbi:toxin-antitoxin system HicB family antitoxin [Holzapfeliella sp. JNUCC 72]